MIIESQNLKFGKNIKGQLLWPFLFSLSRVIPPDGLISARTSPTAENSVSSKATHSTSALLWQSLNSPLHWAKVSLPVTFTQRPKVYLLRYTKQVRCLFHKRGLQRLKGNNNHVLLLQKLFLEKDYPYSLHQAWMRSVPFLLLITLPFRSGLDGRKGE